MVPWYFESWYSQLFCSFRFEVLADFIRARRPFVYFRQVPVLYMMSLSYRPVTFVFSVPISSIHFPYKMYNLYVSSVQKF